MFPGRHQVVEWGVHMPMDPELRFRKALRIEVVHEEGIQSITLEVRVDRAKEGGVMRDNYVGLCLLEKRELSQVQVVPSIGSRTLDLHEIREASRLTSSGMIQIGPERCYGE